MIQLIKGNACINGNHHLCTGYSGPLRESRFICGGWRCTCVCHHHRNEVEGTQLDLPPDLSIVDPGKEICRLFRGHQEIECATERTSTDSVFELISDEVWALCTSHTITIRHINITRECVWYFLQKFYEIISWKVDLQLASDETKIIGTVSPFNTEIMLEIEIVIEEHSDVHTSVIINLNPQL